MRVRSFSIAAAIIGAAMLGVVATVSSAATDATSAPVNKQRIAVEGVYSVVTSKGTFKLIPLTPGPLKADSGTFLGSGVVKPEIIRNGQGVTVITGSDSYAGKNGSFTMIERLEEVTVGGPLAGGARYRILTGTWTFVGGTGAYEDVTGQRCIRLHYLAAVRQQRPLQRRRDRSRTLMASPDSSAEHLAFRANEKG